MAKRTKQQSAEARPEVVPASWPVTLMGLVFLLVQIVFLPGAASAFRLPKEVLAVSGILIVVALATALRLRASSLTLPRGPLVPVLLALPALQLASSQWAGDPRRAVSTAAITATWIAAALWLASITEAERRRVGWWTAIGASVSAMVLLLQAGGVPLLVIGRSAESRFRMSGLAGNPADFATSAVLLLPILMVAVGVGRSRWWRWPLIGLLTVATVLSQTLTGYIALGLLAVVWLVQRKSSKLWAAAAVCGLLAVALAFGTGLGRRASQQFQMIKKGDWYTVLSARGDGWSAAIQMIRAQPAAGVGAGQFTREFYPSRLAWLEQEGTVGRRGESATHFQWAHSDPLQVIAEFGAAGAVWMAALLWALWRTRPRGDPLTALATAATTPFLMLHFPTHLAIGMVPIVLVLGHHLAAQTKLEVPRATGVLRSLVPVVLIAIAAAGSIWQVRRLAVDVWTAELERVVAIAAAATEPVRSAQLASAVELQVMERVERLPGAAPTLWRIVGKSRVARGDFRGAEEAFRISNSLWPHEEAELGLGVALASQGRRSEALILLGRVCRTNPALVSQISDPDLRRSLEDLNRARWRHERGIGR